MQNAICDGTLVVDPMPSSTKPYIYACSLCGENRKDPAHVRSHRFRTSENDSAQRYPLCKYCLGRVRSTCDFLGFLRILKDGHWRADDEEAEKAAWEESVRLREQMFWSRMGGGVVPTMHHNQGDLLKSPRISEEVRREQERKLSDDLERTGEFKPKDITPLPEQSLAKAADVVSTLPDTESTANDSEESTPNDTAAPVVPAISTETEASKKCLDANPVSELPLDQHITNRVSTQSVSSLKAASLGEGEVQQRLSITIP